MAVTYVVGDATRSVGAGSKLVAHVCNDVGAWGSGFVLALTRRWREPETYYRAWHKMRTRDARAFACELSGRALEMTGDFGLGQSQLVGVGEGIFVLNMVAQHGLRPASSVTPTIRYDALALCLRQADAFAKRLGASIHMPRIGCGLGGGSWDTIEPLIGRLVSADVTVYDLSKGTAS